MYVKTEKYAFQAFLPQSRIQQSNVFLQHEKNMAQLACRQLGFSKGEYESITGWTTPSPSNSITFNCDGSEKNLFECRRRVGRQNLDD